MSRHTVNLDAPSLAKLEAIAKARTDGNLSLALRLLLRSTRVAGFEEPAPPADAADDPEPPADAADDPAPPADAPAQEAPAPSAG